MSSIRRLVRGPQSGGATRARVQSLLEDAAASYVALTLTRAEDLRACTRARLFIGRLPEGLPQGFISAPLSVRDAAQFLESVRAHEESRVSKLREVWSTMRAAVRTLQTMLNSKQLLWERAVKAVEHAIVLRVKSALSRMPDPTQLLKDADACKHFGLFYRFLPNLRAMDAAAERWDPVAALGAHCDGLAGQFVDALHAVTESVGRWSSMGDRTPPPNAEDVATHLNDVSLDSTYTGALLEYTHSLEQRLKATNEAFSYAEAAIAPADESAAALSAADAWASESVAQPVHSSSRRKEAAASRAASGSRSPRASPRRADTHEEARPRESGRSPLRAQHAALSPLSTHSAAAAPARDESLIPEEIFAVVDVFNPQAAARAAAAATSDGRVTPVPELIDGVTQVRKDTHVVSGVAFSDLHRGGAQAADSPVIRSPRGGAVGPGTSSPSRPSLSQSVSSARKPSAVPPINLLAPRARGSPSKAAPSPDAARASPRRSPFLPPLRRQMSPRTLDVAAQSTSVNSAVSNSNLRSAAAAASGDVASRQPASSPSYGMMPATQLEGSASPSHISPAAASFQSRLAAMSDALDPALSDRIAVALSPSKSAAAWLSSAGLSSTAAALLAAPMTHHSAAPISATRAAASEWLSNLRKTPSNSSPTTMHSSMSSFRSAYGLASMSPASAATNPVPATTEAVVGSVTDSLGYFSSSTQVGQAMSDLRFSTQTGQSPLPSRGGLRSFDSESRSRTSSFAPQSIYSPAESPKSEFGNADMFHAQAVDSAPYRPGRITASEFADAVPASRKLSPSSFASLYASIALPYVTRAAESAALHGTTLPPIKSGREA